MLRVNIPPVTRILLVLLITLSVFNRAASYGPQLAVFVGSSKHRRWKAPYLDFVPNYSLFYPWVVITATLVEPNLLVLLITAVTLFYGGRYLERAWSSAEFAKFVLVMALVPNVLTAVVWVLIYMGGDGRILIRSIHGGVAIQAGFLVAFKQLVPEHTVTIAKGIIKIRVKHFPALFVLFHIICLFVLGTPIQTLLAIFGFVTSWTYLRFYKVSFADLSVSQPASLRGDASETFAFAHFCPDPIHQPIATVSDAVYGALVAINVIKPFSADDIETSNSQAHLRGEGGMSHITNRGSGVPAPGSARAEAERRRALALKALDQRLHAASSRAQNAAQAAAPSATAEAATPGSGGEDRLAQNEATESRV